MFKKHQLFINGKDESNSWVREKDWHAIVFPLFIITMPTSYKSLRNAAYTHKLQLCAHACLLVSTRIGRR